MDPKLFKAMKYGTPVVLVAFAAWIIWAPPARIGYAPEQPISYRHDIHAGQAGQKTHDGRDQYRPRAPLVSEKGVHRQPLPVGQNGGFPPLEDNL